MKLLHICEVCGKEEILTPEEAFDLGWDYPPKMGAFGVLSPRTCGTCAIEKTLYFRTLMSEKDAHGTVVMQMTDADLELLKRIAAEPESILVEEEE